MPTDKDVGIECTKCQWWAIKPSETVIAACPRCQSYLKYFSLQHHHGHGRPHTEDKKMKIVGNKVDFMMVAPEVLPEDARRWHPVSEITGTVYMVTEKVGHVVVSGYEAGTHDGMRDAASGGFEKFNSIVRIYFDEAGLKEAGYKLPQAPLPAQEKKTCKTHGCPSGFHICTKYA